MTVALSKAIVSLNGIDAITGLPLGAPISPEDVGWTVIREVMDPETADALRKRAAEDVPNYGVRAGINPSSLAEAGWGVVFPARCPGEIIESLQPLLDLRKEQAGGRFRIYTGSQGYCPGDSGRRFLERHLKDPGQVDPDKVPYYLLLVGQPDEIPLSFQYRLDVDYAVGRVGFDSPALYRQYATSIVEQEKSAAGRRRCVLFSVSTPGDDVTSRSALDLMDPLERHAANWANGFEHELIGPPKATRSRLAAELHATEAPAVLFTASHGVGFPCGDEFQLRRQGALLCQDWPGPLRHKGAIPREFYFSGEDLDADSNVRGTIAFLFACYGAGTPREDYFPEQARPDAGSSQPRNVLARKVIAPQDFLAWLPIRMLTHPRGSARAVVAHIERIYTDSFSWPNAGPQIGIYEDALKVLSAGAPIGCATEAFGARYASLNTDIADRLEELRSDHSATPDPIELGRLWTARNDARSFVVLGDPAVLATGGTR